MPRRRPRKPRRGEATSPQRVGGGKACVPRTSVGEGGRVRTFQEGVTATLPMREGTLWRLSGLKGGEWEEVRLGR